MKFRKKTFNEMINEWSEILTPFDNNKINKTSLDLLSFEYKSYEYSLEELFYQPIKMPRGFYAHNFIMKVDGTIERVHGMHWVDLSGPRHIAETDTEVKANSR